MKQALKIPAWAHPENENAPKPADGKSFIPKGHCFVDPADQAAYYSNGAGFFESMETMRSVREHPAHTLLPVTEEDCELGYGHLAKLLHDAQEQVAQMVGKKESAEIKMNWILAALEKRGVKYEQQKIPGSKPGSLSYVMAVLNGYTLEHDDAIRLEVDAWVKAKLDQKERDKQQRKEDREWLRTESEREIAKKMAEQQDEALRAQYQGIYEKALAAGISNVRFNALLKQAAGDKVGNLDAEWVGLLDQFVINEIDVVAKKSGASATVSEPTEPSAPTGVAAEQAGVSESTTTSATETAADSADGGIEAVIQDMAAEAKSQATDISATQDAPAQKMSGGDASNTGTDAPPLKERATYVDEDGSVRYADNNEYVQINADVVAEVLCDAPVSEEKPKFTIDCEGAAKWFIRKVRNSQKIIEKAEADFKEAKNAYEAIKRKEESNIGRLKYCLGQEFFAWLKRFLTIKGVVKTQSHVWMEGKAKLVSSGGLHCYDKKAYTAWWNALSEAERGLYDYTTKHTMTEKQIAANMQLGLPVEGYVYTKPVELSEYEICAAPKPRKRKSDENNEEENEGDEDGDSTEEDAA